MRKVPQLHNNIDRTQYYVLQRENVIGRSEEANIRIENKVVSRRHAKVACAPGANTYYVEDISARGVYVNFHRIKGRHPIKEGDRICFLQFRNIHPIELEKMTPEDLKDSCDDARNESVHAFVDLTFGYAEVEDEQSEEVVEKPTGFLAKLKAIFGRG